MVLGGSGNPTDNNMKMTCEMETGVCYIEASKSLSGFGSRLNFVLGLDFHGMCVCVLA